MEIVGQDCVELNRLAALRATLHTADEKIEAAYDAAERGTPVDVLLHLIAHDLLCTALRPVLRNEDEASVPVTKSDLDAAHDALFPVLAALEGAMALAAGTVLSTMLEEAFKLLNWAQEESDAAALGALLPALPPPPPKPPTVATAEVVTDHMHSPACLVTEGVAVIRCAAMELNSPMVWGLHSLSKVVSAAADKAWDDVSPPDEELLNDVSAQLDELLSLFEAVNNDGLDCMLLYAAESLLNAAKMMIDAKCEELV